MSEAVRAALLRVLTRNFRYPQEYDPDWDSPCRSSGPEAEGHVEWQPTSIGDLVDLSPVEAVLGEPVHPAVRAFYGSFFAGDVTGRFGEWSVYPMTSWNSRALAKTIRSLAEHATVVRAEGLPPTLPIAGTDSCPFFAVVNATGEVVFQDEGRPNRVVAPSLEAFLDAILKW